MNNYKNLLIAILTGLLGLSLFTLPAQGSTKAPDAVNLINYEACLKAQLDFLAGTDQLQFEKAFGEFFVVSTWDSMVACKKHLTKKP